MSFYVNNKVMQVKYVIITLYHLRVQTIAWSGISEAKFFAWEMLLLLEALLSIRSL